MKDRSVKGREVDFALLMAENAEMRALGNANLNARGDLLDSRGKVVQTKEAIADAYHKNATKAVKRVAVRDLESEVFQTPEEAVAEKRAEVEAINAANKKARKIVESD